MLSLQQLEEHLATLEVRAGWWPAQDEVVALNLQIQGRFGFGLTTSVSARREAIALAYSEEQELGPQRPSPREVDWRDQDGTDWVTPVRNQRNCGACVAFATCAVLESRLGISSGEPDLGVDLAEADLFFCGCDNCCDTGWDVTPALERCKDRGVGLEKDFPYRPGNQPCKKITPVVRIASWETAESMDGRMRLLESGPVIAAMRVFEDFSYYRRGVYRHVAGEFLALHAVAVIGYNDYDEYWIVKNSWGNRWGNDGFAKIAYSQCGMDREFPFYAPEID